MNGSIINRPCFWVPDAVGALSLLKAAHGRTISISAPRSLIAAQASSQIPIGAASTGISGVHINQIQAGLWVPQAADTAVLFESIAGAVTTNDTSLSLSILEIHLDLGDGLTFVPLAGNSQLPLVMQGQNQGVWYTWNAILPIALLYPRVSPSANGPIFYASVANSDAVNGHNFGVRLQYTYRLVSGIDFSAGAALSGAGVGA